MQPLASPSLPTLASMNEQETRTFFKGIREQIIHQLRTDEMLIATNTASAATTKQYQDLKDKNYHAMFASQRSSTTWFFMRELLVDYLVEVQGQASLPAALAVDFSDSKVHFWAEIQDDDRAAKRTLLRAQAKINAQYAPYGFHVSSMIVETSDALPVPSHYHVFEPFAEA